MITFCWIVVNILILNILKALGRGKMVFQFATYNLQFYNLPLCHVSFLKRLMQSVKELRKKDLQHARLIF